MSKAVVRVTAGRTGWTEFVTPALQRRRIAAGGPSRRARGPIVEPLRDPAYFLRVALDPVAGTVVWPNGADFAPDFLRELPEEEIVRPRKKLSKFALQRPNRLAARR